jgi:hypothetical protein
MRLLEVAPARASAGMMRRGRNQIKRDAGRGPRVDRCSLGEKYAGAIAKMQIERAAVSTMNGAHRKLLPMALRASAANAAKSPEMHRLNGRHASCC